MTSDTRDNMTNLDTAPSVARFGALTNRERQVATLVCSGLANKLIAHELALTEGTVKQHVCRIYRKLCVRNRSALIIAMLPVPGSVGTRLS
jgi:two-component system, NarL family, nitrate/nitrite response regulator NarL